MNAELEEKSNLNTYRVTSVEKVDPPKGILAGNWYCYIIEQGRSKIEGFKNGSLETVTKHAETVAENLNIRAASPSSTYSVTRKRK